MVIKACKPIGSLKLKDSFEGKSTTIDCTYFSRILLLDNLYSNKNNQSIIDRARIERFVELPNQTPPTEDQLDG